MVWWIDDHRGRSAGTVVGNLLGAHGHGLWLSASVLLGVAVLGWLASLGSGMFPAANPALPFREIRWLRPGATWPCLAIAGH